MSNSFLCLIVVLVVTVLLFVFFLWSNHNGGNGGGGDRLQDKRKNKLFEDDSDIPVPPNTYEFNRSIAPAKRRTVVCSGTNETPSFISDSEGNLFLQINEPDYKL